MKKLYATIIMGLMALTASAQTDSIYVRIDFNLNPWNLPVSIPNRDKGENANWATVDDETGCFTGNHVFDCQVADGEIIQLTLTPSNYKLTDYDNAMVYTHNLNMTGEPFETMLWMRRGSTLSFKAPKSFWFAKVAFDVYRHWASGGLYSGDDTNNQYIWGKDSVKSHTSVAGGVEYFIEHWSGDSIEWSLPECTGNTYLRYIDVWLLSRSGETGISQLKSEARRGDVLSIDGVLLRRDGKLDGLRKGIYIVDGKKRVVR